MPEECMFNNDRPMYSVDGGRLLLCGDVDNRERALGLEISRIEKV